MAADGEVGVLEIAVVSCELELSGPSKEEELSVFWEEELPISEEEMGESIWTLMRNRFATSPLVTV